MSNTDTFNSPAAPGSSGDKMPPMAELLGTLLLFTVDKQVDGIVTEFGETSAIAVSVALLDGDKKGKTFDDQLIFAKVMQSQLRNSVGGGMVLGRLAQGEKKPGKSAPWLLTDPTEADRATARKYLEYVATQAAAAAAAAANDAPF